MKSDPYKDVAIEDLKILDIFWESSEELSEEFPWWQSCINFY